MKVILSRKGMDSKSGGIANPILPDGTLLSLPIPDKTAGTAYKDCITKSRVLRKSSVSYILNLILTKIRPVTLTPIYMRI